MKKSVLFIILVLVSFQEIKAQEVPEEYKLLSMLALYSEGLNTNTIKISEFNLNKFITKKVALTIIKQNSFRHFKFISIKGRTNFDKSFEKKDLELPVVWNTREEYILAIEKGSNYVYKLKGFINNDFHSFLVSLIRLEYSKIKSPRSFAKHYVVEGLDFKCLYKGLKIKNKKHFRKYPCLDETCLKMMRTHGNDTD